MRKLRVLDLFCGAGGVAQGLMRAGCEVVGVDIEPQPRYPGKFMRGDVLSVCRAMLKNPAPMILGHRLDSFDFIWASPPCQRWTELRHAPGTYEHPDLITPTRVLLKKMGLPWVIENVEGAAVALRDPVMLCGSHFGLGVDVGGTVYHLERHRLFEATFEIIGHPEIPCNHKQPVVGVYGGHARCRSSAHGGRGTADFKGYDQRSIAEIALDIEGQTLMEMSQAVPPAYAEHIVRAFRASRK